VCFVRRWLVAVVEEWRIRGCTTGHPLVKCFLILVERHLDSKSKDSGKSVNEVDAVC
jgi:hypothetical protein